VAPDAWASLSMRKYYRAQGIALALRVVAERVQGAGFAALAVFADGEPEIVEFAVMVGNHGIDGGERRAGGVFVGAIWLASASWNARGAGRRGRVFIGKDTVGEVAFVGSFTP